MKMFQSLKRITAIMAIGFLLSILIPASPTYAAVTVTPTPVIAAHADVSVPAVSLSGATVNYDLPLVTDAPSTEVPIAVCTPASGTLFPIGTTLVGCTAVDSAGSAAVPTSFNVTVSAPDPTAALTVQSVVTTNNPLPKIQGTITDPAAQIAVSVHNLDRSISFGYAGVNKGDGTWSAQVTDSLPVGSYILEAGTLDPLNFQYAAGTYVVQALPIVKLNGDQKITLEVGSDYTEQGATATDTTNVVLASNIQPTGTVNTGLIGTYSLVYNFTDEAGNAAIPVTRTVDVVARLIVVTANPQTKVQGTADPVFTYAYTGNLMIGDSFSGALTRMAGETVGDYVITKGDLTLNDNYVVIYNGANFSITAAPKVALAVNEGSSGQPVVTSFSSNPTPTPKGEVKSDQKENPAPKSDPAPESKSIPAFGIAILILLLLFGIYLIYQQKPEWFEWLIFWKKK